MLAFASQLLATYKYWIVIGGALLEGEAVLLLAGGSAYHGHINLYWVMVIAFLGALIHDHLLFFLGRHLGKKFFRHYPKINKKLRKISRLLKKYDNLFILGFRFIYGIRTLTPMILGTTSISTKKYSLMTFIAALIWATSVAYVGYSCALMIEAVSDNFNRYQKYLLVALITLLGGGFMIYKWRRKRRIKQIIHSLPQKISKKP